MKPKISKVLGMTILFLCVLLLLNEAIFAGSVHVRGYYRKNGTYVQPHYRSAPDGNFYNNWSTKGNFNPYTGKEGTKISPPNKSGNGIASSVYKPQPSNAPTDVYPYVDKNGVVRFSDTPPKEGRKNFESIFCEPATK